MLGKRTKPNPEPVKRATEFIFLQLQFQPSASRTGIHLGYYQSSAARTRLRLSVAWFLFPQLAIRSLGITIRISGISIRSVEIAVPSVEIFDFPQENRTSDENQSDFGD